MKSPQKRLDFLTSDEGTAVRQELMRMTSDAGYNAPASYTSKVLEYPDNLMPFVDKHMQYLCLHPQLNAQLYMANLRLKSKLSNRTKE